jgi:hypothetical protein
MSDQSPEHSSPELARQVRLLAAGLGLVSAKRIVDAASRE